MGQLTNQYVSSSYQGLLKMTDSTTGVTSTLQTVQTGDGTNTPLQISQTQVNISGSLTVNGSPISVDTGSLVTTSSFNAYTSSNDSKVNSLIAATASYITNSQTSSMSVASASYSNYAVSSSEAAHSISSSYALNAISSSYAQNATSASFAQNALSASYAPSNSNRDGLITTGSIGGNQSITGSLDVQGTISATSASFTYLKTIYETSSVIFSSGSNILGDASNDTQTLWGTVNLPSGPLVITGSVTSSAGFNGNLQGTASYATNGLSSSNAIYADTASYFNGSITSASFADYSNYTNAVIKTVKNNTASTLLKGRAVYITGATGDNANVAYADYCCEDSTIGVIGLLNQDITAGNTGSVLLNGTLLGVNTSGYTAGDVLFLSSSGQWTNVEPLSPNQLVILGKVLRVQQINGSVDVTINNGWELEELHNVLISNPQQGNLLSYVSGSYGLWQNKTNSELGLNTTSSFNAYTSSNDTKVNALIAQTGSYVTETESGSFMTTGSIAGNVLTFTKGNGTTFDITIDTGSNSNRNGLITTGSLVGSQLISGSLRLSSNLSADSINVTTSLLVSSSAIISGSLTVTGSLALSGSLSLSGAINVIAGTTTTNGIQFEGNAQTRIFSSGSNLYIRTPNSLIISPGGANKLQYISTAGNTITSSLYGYNEITGSQSIKSGSLSLISQNTTVSINYLTSSDQGQSNIIQGWGDNPTPGGAGATQANYTSSLAITGSNNIVSMPQIRATGLGGGTDQQGYISGSSNFILNNGSGIYLNTGSLLFPKLQTNLIGNGSGILMNFTTSSLAGGHPILSNNLVFGGNIFLNSNSGSAQTVGQNMILGGGITSTQNFVTNTRPSITGNNVIGNVTLNHISSSINYQQNYNNSVITVNNHLSSSGIALNSLNVTNNAFFGGSSGNGHTVYASGSQSTNAVRSVIDNLIGGRNIVVTSSFVSSSNSNLLSTLIVGNALTVSGSHTLAGNGGSAFLGRFNDTGSLNTAQEIVFAVGTGTAAGSRRTGLYVTSGSLVGVSGSLNVTGSVGISTAMNLAPQSPLPAGNIGDLAVSSSNQLYFYNGAWTLIV